MPSPKIVTIAVEGSERYIAVDSQGRVWQGRIETHRGGDRFINWRRIEHEFPRDG
jgi:hypothetical protein